MKWWTSLLDVVLEPVRRWQRNARKREQPVPEYDGRHPSKRRRDPLPEAGRTLRGALALVVLAGATGCSTSRGGSGFKPQNDQQRHIADLRLAEIKRQAPQMGIPVELALQTKLNAIHLCAETGRDKRDGSYTCNDCVDASPDCVHAWFRGSKRYKRAEYMFATPDTKDGTVRHEVHHELCVIWYGIGGHPKKSTVTRVDNGKPLTLNHGSIIQWRWPALVNWALPAAMEIGSEWGDDLKCGVHETFQDGGGI